MKEKLEKVEGLNANLQQELLITKNFLQMPNIKNDCVNKDVIVELKKRLDRNLSDDKVIIFRFIIFISYMKNDCNHSADLFNGNMRPFKKEMIPYHFHLNYASFNSKKITKSIT